MSDLKIQGEVTFDTTSADQALGNVEQRANRMAQNVGQAGEKAGKAVSGIGDGGQQSSQKVEAATRSMIQSIQRTTAAMEAGSKSSSQYYEALASQRGVSSDALRPYLAQLEAVEAKQKQATVAMTGGAVSMEKMGVSAAQTAAALRGVPAQFTDIVTSLQGGQKPMTVLLQQGGQLKDMFGGIGPAARALGGYVAGLINPFTLTAAAVAGLVVAYRSGAAEGEAFRNTLLLSGNAAGLTADKMSGMSQRIGAVVGTQHAAAAALNEFANASKIGSANLEQFTASALRWQDATGTAVSETVKKFEDLGKSPLEASLKLNESMNYLTASVYKQIKSLQDAGKETEAAAVAQKAFADALDQRAPKMVENIGGIEAAWRAVKGVVLEVGSALAGIGREKTFEESVKSQSAAIDALQAKIKSRQDRGLALGNLPAQLEAAQRYIDTLGAQAVAEDKAAQAARDRNGELTRTASILAYTDDKSRKTRAQQMSDDLAKEKGLYEQRKADAQGNAKDLLAIENSYHTAVANIRDKYKDKKSGGGGITATDTEIASLRGRIEAEKQLAAQLAATGGMASKLNEGEKLSLQYAEKLKLATNAKTKARLEDLKAMADTLGVQQHANADEQEYAKQREKYADDRYKEISAIQSKAAAMESENAVYGMGKDAIEQMTIARLDEQRAALKQFDGSEERIKQIDLETEARKRLMAAMSEREALDAGKKAAESVASEWKRQTNEISRSLTDALMRGFESGKDFGQNLIDTLKNMFKTLVLRPIISAVMAPVTGMVGSAMGAVGMPGSAQAGGMGDVLGMGQQANSAYGLYNNAGGYYNYAMNTLYGSGVSAATGSTFGAAAGGLTSGAFGTGAGASIYGGYTAGAYGVSAGLPTVAGTEAGLALSSSAAAPAASASLSSTAASAGAAPASSTLGAVALPVAGMAAGYGLGSMISGQYSAIGNTQAWATGGGTLAGAGIGFMVGGPVGAAIGAVIGGVAGGLTNRAFGMGPKEYNGFKGFEGNVTASGFSGQNFMDWNQKGGWFRSDKSGTDYSPVDQKVLDGINAQFGGMVGAIAGLRKSAGGPAFGADLNGFNYGLRNDWSSQENINKSFHDLGDALGNWLIPELNNFKKEGESLVDTAKRLTTVFDATNTAAEILGKSTDSAFGGFYMAGAEMRVKLVDMAGGIDAFTSRLTAYYDAYFSDAEKLDRSQKALAAQFSALGVAVPSSKESFRAMVEGLDLATASGQGMYTALMQMAPAFAQVTDAANAAVEAARQAAQQAADARQGLWDSYFSATYSPEEQLAKQVTYLRDQFAALGVAMPTSVAGLRQIIEHMDTSTPEVMKLQGALLALSPAFAQVTKDTQAAADSAAQLRQQTLDSLRNDVSAAYQRETSALNTTIASLQQFIRGIEDFKKSLLLGDLSTLTPEQKYQEAKRQFEATSAAAAGGDATAQGQLSSVSQSFLEASRAYNASGEAYQRDFAEVQSALSSAASSASAQLSAAQQQLDAMNQMVAGILGVNTSVQSLAEAVRAFLAERAAQVTAQVTGAYQQYLGRAPDQAGLDYWTQALSSGTKTQDDMRYSAGFEQVNKIYQSVLGREGDSAGLQFYADQLYSGRSLAEIQADFEWGAAHGSHANGLAYVPFDGYRAELHKGERVLTADENRSYQMPDWSQYGRGGNEALASEVKALRTDLVAANQRIEQLLAARVQQAHAHQAENKADMAAQTREVRKTKEAVENQ
jgi:phage-related minor tail protein